MGPNTTTITFDDLAALLPETCRRPSALLIGIDGGGGAGKTVFASGLQAAFRRRGDHAAVVQMDDFFRPSAGQLGPAADGFVDGELDWQRLLQQVITPIRQDRPGRYQRFDWPSRNLQEWHDVPAEGAILIEGIRTLRRDLAPLYDYRIWIDCPRSIRLGRGVARDGEQARRRWELDWLPADDCFVEQHQPLETADLVVDGTARPEMDPSRFFVALRG